jgi:DNA-binding response OmpR family regulator
MNLNIGSLELLGKNIVIIEDDQPSISYYKAILSNTGAEVKIFHSGKEFVDYLADENIKIDLIFIDFLIPLVNGIECVRIFRKERKSTPVIMITAYSSELTKKEAFLAGCNEYLLKPIYPEKVFYLLDKYLRSNISATYSS